jgi:DnaJ-class molecular chaperone
MSYSDDSHPHTQETGVFVRTRTRCRDCQGTGPHFTPGRPPTQCPTCGGDGVVYALVWRPLSQGYQQRHQHNQPGQKG